MTAARGRPPGTGSRDRTPAVTDGVQLAATSAALRGQAVASPPTTAPQKPRRRQTKLPAADISSRPGTPLLQQLPFRLQRPRSGSSSPCQDPAAPVRIQQLLSGLQQLPSGLQQTTSGLQQLPSDSSKQLQSGPHAVPAAPDRAPRHYSSVRPAPHRLCSDRPSARHSISPEPSSPPPQQRPTNITPVADFQTRSPAQCRVLQAFSVDTSQGR